MKSFIDMTHSLRAIPCFEGLSAMDTILLLFACGIVVPVDLGRLS